MVHEMVHAMDLLKLGTYYQGGWDYWSDTPGWTDRLPQDGWLATDYARTNYIESFAEVGRLYSYDIRVPGGLAALPQDQTLISNQLWMFRVLDPELRQPRCNGKVASSPLLPVSNRKRGAPAPKPDISITKVPVIEVNSTVYDMKPTVEDAFELTY